MSAAVDEMCRDEEANTGSNSLTAVYDPVEWPLGEQMALYPKERAALMELLPAHPKVRKGISLP